MKEKNEILFSDNKEIEKLFIDAIKTSKDNPDLNLPPSSYLDEHKILKKQRKKQFDTNNF